MNVKKYKQMEEENRELKDKVSKLEQVLKNKTLFSRMIGHELGNDLWRILAYSEILLDKGWEFPKEDVIQYLKSIHRGARQGAINFSLLRVSDLASIKENSEYFHLGDLAENFIQSKKEETKNRSLSYSHVGENPKIYTSKAIMNSLVGTLLGNSLNYALPNSTIFFRPSLDKKKGFLEAFFINETDGLKKSNSHGEGKGLGLEFVKVVMDIYEGNFQNFQKGKKYISYFKIPLKHLVE